jgi:hypothetical protein
MSHVQVNPGYEKEDSDQFDGELASLQLQIDQIRERLARLSVDSADDAVLARLVQEILRSRRLRERMFGSDLFGEPAWDILLELFGAQYSKEKMSVSGACYASAVPVTTALRWISKLENDGWVQRAIDPRDGRRHWLHLTEWGNARIRGFLSELAIRPM